MGILSFVGKNGQQMTQIKQRVQYMLYVFRFKLFIIELTINSEKLKLHRGIIYNFIWSTYVVRDH